ncbi:hypothetical protein AB0C90_02590 [Streptomyces sp. NPDC048550]
MLSTLGELAHPEREAVGLRHAHHPSPYVRAEALASLRGEHGPADG